MRKFIDEFIIFKLFNCFLATICSSAARGNVLTLTGNDPSSWTQYRYNFTAVSSSHIVMFGFKNENNREYYFDSASVTLVNASNIQLLTNPSFESSISSPTGWVVWCSSTCSGYVGAIASGTNCYLGSGNCFKVPCYASSGIEFLGQSIATTVGLVYTVSFRLILGGNGNTGANGFYFDFV